MFLFILGLLKSSYHFMYISFSLAVWPPVCVVYISVCEMVVFLKYTGQRGIDCQYVTDFYSVTVQQYFKGIFDPGIQNNPQRKETSRRKAKYSQYHKAWEALVWAVLVVCATCTFSQQGTVHAVMLYQLLLSMGFDIICIFIHGLFTISFKIVTLV